MIKPRDVGLLIITIIFWIIFLVCAVKSSDIYDMTPEPKIRVVISADENNSGHKQMLKTASEMQSKGFDILTQLKPDVKLKTVIFIGSEAKQETTETLTKEQIVDWILAVAVNKPIPEKSIFKLCTEDCPEGTCETVKEDEQQQHIEPKRRVRIFRR